MAANDDRPAWAVTFSETERDEIVRATEKAAAAGATTTSVTAAEFPLPTLEARVAGWSAEVERGRGFVLLRGFPVDRLDAAATELAYVGFGSHFGTPVGQDKQGSLLGHIRDERIPRTGPEVRLYRTRERQDFHTDGADLVALLCLHRARRGGESRIARSEVVYEEMRRRRPDLVEVMHQPMYWDRNDEQRPGEDPFFRLAPFSTVDGKPRIFYIGWYIRDAQRHAAVPRLTPEQLEAMALLESIANDPAFHTEMDFRPGDIQLLSNSRILHAREAYEDDEDPARRRHLLRLWLAAHRFAAVEPGLRRGIS